MTTRGIFSESARLLLRHQRIVWWLFFVGLVLAWLGSIPARATMGFVLNHSMAASKLVNGFDVSTFAELVTMPEVPLPALISAAVAPSVIWVVFLLFVMGGILSVYREDRKLSRAEFFENSGAYFWRMVRITLISIIPFVFVGVLFSIVRRISNRAVESPNERLSWYLLWGGAVIVGLIALWIRTWFDVAQARAVARNERGMIRNAMQAFKEVSAKLYGTYVVITALRIALVLAGLWLWSLLPHRATAVSFVVLQVVILVHIALRLWQRAASVAWYERYSPPLFAPVAAPIAQPVIEPAPPEQSPAQP